MIDKRESLKSAYDKSVKQEREKIAKSNAALSSKAGRREVAAKTARDLQQRRYVIKNSQNQCASPNHLACPRQRVSPRKRDSPVRRSKRTRKPIKKATEASSKASPPSRFTPKKNRKRKASKRDDDVVRKKKKAQKVKPPAKFVESKQKAGQSTGNFM